MAQEVETGSTSTTIVPGHNWNASEAFAEAIKAAEEVKAADDEGKSAATKRSAAICRSLQLTLRLFEHGQDGHVEEVNGHLAGCGHKPAKDEELLVAIVRCVFDGETPQSRTWRTNALRQVIAEKRRSDDVMAYFDTTKPTAAAREWSKRDRLPPREVPLGSCAAELPPHCKPEAGKTKTIQIKALPDGGLVFLVPPEPKTKTVSKGKAS